MTDTYATLSDQYEKFCLENNLPLISADEQDQSKLTNEQKQFLREFINRWESCEN